MRHGRSAAGRDVAGAINQVEGYLLWQAELHKTRTEAEAFADRMPWLTTAQHEEVVRLYADERLTVTKDYLRTIARRCHELREEYTTRYLQLRRRLLCLSITAVTSAIALWAATLAYSSH